MKTNSSSAPERVSSMTSETPAPNHSSDSVVAIENDFFAAEIAKKGGAFHSLVYKKTGEQLLFTGAPNSWNERDIVLFPFIGRCQDNYYLHRGVRYESLLHGFAHRLDFTATEKTAASVTMELGYSTETLAIYPFAFRLSVRYTLHDNAVEVRYSVKNEGESQMYFAVGGHFGVSLGGTESPGGDETLGNFLDFDWQQTLVRKLEGLFVLPFEKCPPFSRVEASKAFFEPINTLIVESRDLPFTVTIKRKDGTPLEFRAASPLMSFWTHPKYGKFICVEPWWGLPDAARPHRELSEKEHINVLGAGETFTCGYEIKVPLD